MLLRSFLGYYIETFKYFIMKYFKLKKILLSAEQTFI